MGQQHAQNGYGSFACVPVKIHSMGVSHIRMQADCLGATSVRVTRARDHASEPLIGDSARSVADQRQYRDHCDHGMPHFNSGWRTCVDVSLLQHVVRHTAA